MFLSMDMVCDIICVQNPTLDVEAEAKTPAEDDFTSTIRKFLEDLDGIQMDPQAPSS